MNKPEHYNCIFQYLILKFPLAAAHPSKSDHCGFHWANKKSLCTVEAH